MLWGGGGANPKGGSDIPLGLLVVPLVFLVPGPENMKGDLDDDLRRQQGVCLWRSSEW